VAKLRALHLPLFTAICRAFREMGNDWRQEVIAGVGAANDVLINKCWGHVRLADG